jgi:hypothetical protein
MMASRSFIIPASNQTMVEGQIEKLNNRAKKLGLEDISLTWEKAFLDSKENLLIPCILNGPTSISYDGWEFIATLQHLPTGENIIRAIADDADIPLRYRFAGCDCEHCNSKRYRKDTYIVRHAPSPTDPFDYFQIGSSCIKDFLGGNSPDNILQKASFISELISFMNNSTICNGSHDEGVFHIVKFLAHTSACIRDYGWLSKGKAYEAGGTATATRVQDNLQPTRDYVVSKVTTDDWNVAKEATEWAENISDSDADTSDYLHNIRAIARSGMVGYRTCGFAASIINAYERDLRDKAPVQVSEYVGAIKSRAIFQLRLNHCFAYEGSYGTTRKYIFQDESGNVMIWSTTSNQDLEVGKKYGVKGTIKSHEEYRHVKQTYISRCEVVTNY